MSISEVKDNDDGTGTSMGDQAAETLQASLSLHLNRLLQGLYISHF